MSTAISIPRFHDDPRAGQSSQQQQQPQDNQHRSFQPGPSFQFEYQDLAAIKATESRLDFGLSDLSNPTRDTHNSASYDGAHGYEPTPLQIPAQSNQSEHPPSAYMPSATSATFPYPPSSHSRSLSPGDHTGWTDSSSLHSLSPPDAAQSNGPDLAYDTQLAHMSFPMGLQSSQPSLQILPPTPPRDQPRPRAAKAQAALAPSKDADVPVVKLGPNGLAEDQPPTAQGKMRTRVYVACLQCRSRKIRCDGAKPKCQKCTRRSSDCDYDAAPKRRGPDKKPGARQRTSKKSKTAKEEVEQLPGAASHRPKRCDADDPGSPTRKRRRPSAAPARSTWPADSEDVDSVRGSTTTSSCSNEGAAPATPRDPPAVTMRELTSITDVSEVSTMSVLHDKPPSHIPNRHDTVPHLPTSHDRLTYDFNTSSIDLIGAHHHQDLSPTRVHSRHATLSSHAVASLNFPYFPPAAHIKSADEEDEDDRRLLHQKRKWSACNIGSEPSLEFTRKTWWDSLLAIYIPGSDRVATARQVHTDLQFLFKSSNYFFSFINVPLFFSVFCNPVERDKMQPSLVLACLAISIFMKSSELNGGSAGRLRAMWLRDAAQSALEASFNARWIEPTLAQAAWLLAMFEMCAHPYHSSERSSSSMVMLDSIIRSLALTSIDANEPSASVFSPRAVPIVPVSAVSRVSRQEGCSCRTLTLGHVSRGSHEHTPLWVATAAWHPDWTYAEMRKEESRRLCWSTLQLAASHTAHAAAFSAPPLDFFCIQPGNYALLFPGEALVQSSRFTTSHSAKESVWALYSRAMLLWNSCLRMRGDDVSDNDKAAFAVNAWIESTAIEEALDAHTCMCDQAFLYQGREFLFITRMCISHEFSRFIPHPESEVNGLFNRKKAEAWLVHQATVAQLMMRGLHTVTGHKQNVLAQRPFFVWWFMGQMARSLKLWQCDHTLVKALEVCQAFFPPIDYLSCLWPCPAQRSRYLNLHARLVQACRTARLPPPPVPNFDLLAPGSPPVTVV